MSCVGKALAGMGGDEAKCTERANGLVKGRGRKGKGLEGGREIFGELAANVVHFPAFGKE